MDSNRRVYDQFLRLHACKARATTEPTVHVMFYNGTLSHHEPLVAMTIPEVCAELDTSAELVRWLLRQMHTYECTKQKIVCLIFDRQTVLSDVLRA
jgi:hypothetical protein